MTSAQATTVQLTARQPRLTGEEMLASLVPPPQFDGATFDTYRADDAYPSRSRAPDCSLSDGRRRRPSRR
jgi:cell division protein ZapE